eukprot:IDg9936t1
MRCKTGHPELATEVGPAQRDESSACIRSDPIKSVTIRVADIATPGSPRISTRGGDPIGAVHKSKRDAATTSKCTHRAPAASHHEQRSVLPSIFRDCPPTHPPPHARARVPGCLRVVDSGQQCTQAWLARPSKAIALRGHTASRVCGRGAQRAALLCATGPPRTCAMRHPERAKEEGGEGGGGGEVHIHIARGAHVARGDAVYERASRARNRTGGAGKRM